MKTNVFLFSWFAVVTTVVHAFQVRQVFREERFTRGNVNLRQMQPADDADWIWIDDGGPTKNEMDAVRFSCSFDAVATPLEIDVSGDERFVLFLDGREIARGPHKGAVNHWYYETYAIDGLESGTHRMEAVVYRMESRRPLGVLTSGKGGFLMKANKPYNAALTTGTAPWRAVRVRGTRMEGFGDSEGFGCSGQSVSAGTGFLDSAAATGAPCAVRTVCRRIRDNEYGTVRLGWALFPTERPDQMSVPRRAGTFKAGQHLYRADSNEFYSAADAKFPLVAEMNALLKEGRSVTFPANTKARLIWDLGDYWCGYPQLDVSGGKGAEIRWGWAESLYDRKGARGDRNAFNQKRCAHALRDTFRPDGRAAAHFTSPWWRCGRWCELEIRTVAEPLFLNGLSFTEVRYPLDVRASFDCDDETISDIWGLCRRGLENCLHETYMDCPYFEQLMYPGDTRIQMLLVDVLSGDPRLTRFGAGMFDYARGEDGRVPMSFQCDLRQTSSTFSMVWVTMLGDYALWQGSDSWLKARLPGMRHTMHALVNQLNADGLLVNPPGWSFIDWAETWDFYGNAPDGRCGLSGVVNLLLAYALGAAEHVDTAMGDADMATYWRKKKDALAQAVLSKFWCEKRGLVADTVAKDKFSEHAQCLALLTGVLPPDRETRVLKGLLEDGDLAHTTVYFSHYLFDVLVKYGYTDVFLKRLNLWRKYVKTGLKTPLEAPGVRARSDCHAWGAHPIYHLLTGVAGIRPASDGFSSVIIAPQPSGLKWIRASMPSPKGMLAVDLRFDGVEPSGTITLPEKLPGTFFWKGKSLTLTAGQNTLR